MAEAARQLITDEEQAELDAFFGKDEAPADEGDEIEIAADDAGGDPEPSESEVPEEPTSFRGKRKVPYRELAEAQRQHNEALQRLNELQAKFTESERARAILDDRWNQILDMKRAAEARAAQQQQPQAPIDPNEDVFAAVAGDRQRYDGRFETLEQRLQRIESERQQQQQRQAEEAWWDQTNRSMATAEESFKQRVPDYTQALTFLRGSIDAELAAQGVADPNQRASLIAQQTRNFVVHQLRNNRPPWEAAYEVARARGYQPGQMQPATGKMEQIQRGQAANKTLSNASGTATSAGSLTTADVAAMPQKDFERLFAKIGAEGIERIMARG